jgi:hypothetical protein
MKNKSRFVSTCFLSVVVLMTGMLWAQVQPADYERAAGLREKFQSMVQNNVDQTSWIEGTSRFWYRKSIQDGNAFYIVDADKLTKKIAFNHERLAASLSEVLKEEIAPYVLPFRSIQFVDKEQAIRFDVGDWTYSCDLISYACKREGEARRRGSRDPFTTWIRGPAPEAASEEVRTSPDKKWDAFIRNYNIFIRDTDTEEEFALSHDGSEGNYYTFATIRWSPDSKKLAAFRLKRGYHRIIHYVESSPDEQLQAIHR